MDAFDRQLLVREIRKDGSYSVTGIPGIEESKVWTSAIESTRPKGFMFTPESVFGMFYEEQKKARSGKGSKEPFEVSLSKPYQLYFSIVSYTSQRITDLLSHTAYVGPLRERPRRIYELGGERPFSVGPTGVFAPEILFRNRRSGLLDKVNDWIRKFEFGEKIRADKLTESVFNVTLQHQRSSPRINIADTGFGLSQVLPLIVQGFFGAKDSLILAEQPEIHLNPRLQAVLADLFVAIASRGVYLVIETHSEHFLLRLRRLIAERKFDATKLALYFTERQKDESFVKQIPIDANGHITSNEWPKGFFEESLREALALAAAQGEGRAS